MYEVKIGCRLRQLNSYLILSGKEILEGLDMTSSQSLLLDYLLSKKQREYCLTDICGELGVSKATVSMLLKELRRSGYLKMKADPNDDRKKKIVLSDKAFAVQEELAKRLRNRGNCMFRGITDEELQNLEDTLDKMIQNLKKTTE